MSTLTIPSLPSHHYPSIGDACMGPFVDTYASILLARRKLDAGTRQVTSS